MLKYKGAVLYLRNIINLQVTILFILYRGTSSSVDKDATVPPKKNATIIFHVCIPEKIWGWNSKSHLYMELSSPGWGNGIGEFIKKR